MLQFSRLVREAPATHSLPSGSHLSHAPQPTLAPEFLVFFPELPTCTHRVCLPHTPTPRHTAGTQTHRHAYPHLTQEHTHTRPWHLTFCCSRNRGPPRAMGLLPRALPIHRAGPQNLLPLWVPSGFPSPGFLLLHRSLLLGLCYGRTHFVFQSR